MQCHDTKQEITQLIQPTCVQRLTARGHAPGAPVTDEIPLTDPTAAHLMDWTREGRLKMRLAIRRGVRMKWEWSGSVFGNLAHLD